MKKLFYLMTIIIFTLVFACPLVFSETKQKISLKPLNEKGLKKSVSKGGMDEMFGRIPLQKGVITYYAANGQNMFIISEEMVNKYGSKDHKLLLKTLKEYLNGQNKHTIVMNKNQNKDIPGLFDDCIDYGCSIKGNISGIKYPGMDKVIATYSFDSQDPPAAAVNVRIFARRGNNYVMLVRDTGLTVCSQKDGVSPALNTCLIKNDVTPKCEKCSIDALNSEAVAKGILRRAAENLVNRFKIK